MIEYIVGYLAIEYLHQNNIKNQAIGYVNSIPGYKLNIGAMGINQITKSVSLNNDLETKCDIVADYTNNISFCELGHRLPYNDKSFSVVMASHVVEHVAPDKVRCALREMSRVGEIVVIVLPNPIHHGFYTAYGHLSKIYKIQSPNGLHIRSMDDAFQDTIYLDTERFKIYQ